MLYVQGVENCQFVCPFGSSVDWRYIQEITRLTDTPSMPRIDSPPFEAIILYWLWK